MISAFDEDSSDEEAAAEETETESHDDGALASLGRFVRVDTDTSDASEARRARSKGRKRGTQHKCGHNHKDHNASEDDARDASEDGAGDAFEGDAEDAFEGDAEDDAFKEDSEDAFEDDAEDAELDLDDAEFEFGDFDEEVDDEEAQELAECLALVAESDIFVVDTDVDEDESAPEQPKSKRQGDSRKQGKSKSRRESKSKSKKQDQGKETQKSVGPKIARRQGRQEQFRAISIGRRISEMTKAQKGAVDQVNIDRFKSRLTNLVQYWIDHARNEDWDAPTLGMARTFRGLLLRMSAAKFVEMLCAAMTPRTMSLMGKEHVTRSDMIDIEGYSRSEIFGKMLDYVDIVTDERDASYCEGYVGSGTSAKDHGGLSRIDGYDKAKFSGKSHESNGRHLPAALKKDRVMNIRILALFEPEKYDRRFVLFSEAVFMTYLATLDVVSEYRTKFRTDAGLKIVAEATPMALRQPPWRPLNLCSPLQQGAERAHGICYMSGQGCPHSDLEEHLHWVVNAEDEEGRMVLLCSLCNRQLANFSKRHNSCGNVFCEKRKCHKRTKVKSDVQRVFKGWRFHRAETGQRATRSVAARKIRADFGEMCVCGDTLADAAGAFGKRMWNSPIPLFGCAACYVDWGRHFSHKNVPELEKVEAWIEARKKYVRRQDMGPVDPEVDKWCICSTDEEPVKADKKLAGYTGRAHLCGRCSSVFREAFKRPYHLKRDNPADMVFAIERLDGKVMSEEKLLAKYPDRQFCVCSNPSKPVRAWWPFIGDKEGRLPGIAYMCAGCSADWVRAVQDCNRKRKGDVDKAKRELGRVFLAERRKVGLSSTRVNGSDEGDAEDEDDGEMTVRWTRSMKTTS